MTRVALFIIALLPLVACGPNRVTEVISTSDTATFYKEVPVVYGVGIAEGSSPIEPYDYLHMDFAQYDPVTRKGTSNCWRNRDQIQIDFPVTWEYSHPRMDHKLHYHVVMVPSGFYALTRGSGLSVRDAVANAGIIQLPYEATPSLYFKIDFTGAYYLGDFWFIKSPSPDKNIVSPTFSTLPVEYHEEEAKRILQKFDISSEGLKKVLLVPTQNMAEVPACFLEGL